MRIDAAVLRERDAPFGIERVELADPAADELLVRIAGTGFCHTDVLPRGDGFPARPPMVCGHEGAGVVVAAGEGARTPVGARVVLSFDSCGRCASCRRGHPAYCAEFFARNLSGTGTGPGRITDSAGGTVGSRWFGQSSFASHALVAERGAVEVADDLPLELLGPLGCGIQTGAGAVLNSLAVAAGASIVVLGAGAVGLAAVMAARVAGATTIIAVDRTASRLRLAEELGATHVLDVSRADRRAIRALAPGGADHALDTTGAPAVIATAVDAVRQQGTVGLVAAGTAPLTLAPGALAGGKVVMGILEGDAVPQTFIPALIALFRQGRFPFDRLLTPFPLADIARAEEEAASGRVVKPVLVPEAAA